MYLQVEPVPAIKIIESLRRVADRAGDRVHKARKSFDQSGLHEALKQLKAAMDDVQVFQDALTLSQVDEMMELRKVG